MNNIGILTGGDSAEYNISLLSAETVLKHLKQNKYKAEIIHLKNGKYCVGQQKIDTSDLNIKWNQVTKDTNLTTGYFTNINVIKQTLGNFTTSLLKLVKIGASIKFQAPDGKHFTPEGTLKDGAANYLGSTSYKWVKIVNVNGNGTLNNNDGSGPVLVNDVIPTDALLVEIRPSVTSIVQDDVKTQIVDQVFAYKTFGLRFDRDLKSWKLDFSWVPFSPRASWNFFIGIKSGLLSDLKYEKRSEPDRSL